MPWPSEPELDPRPSAPMAADPPEAAPPPEERADEELLEPPRLVAARMAVDKLRPPVLAPAVDPPPPVDPPIVVLPPLRAATFCDPPPEKLAPRIPPSRPKPPRLPRICGTISDTNRSAPVTPASRKVLSSFPFDTDAFRNATGPPPEVFVLAFWSQYQVPKPINPRTPTPQSQPRLGRSGSCGGAAGGTSWGCFGSPGLGDGKGSGLGDALDADIILNSRP